MWSWPPLRTFWCAADRLPTSDQTPDLYLIVPDGEISVKEWTHRWMVSQSQVVRSSLVCYNATRPVLFLST
jgi:hypothetical protein